MADLITESVCILGKIQHRRVQFCTITDINVEYKMCDLMVESTIDGKNAYEYLFPIYEEGGILQEQDFINHTNYPVIRLLTRRTGQNHSLHFLRRFRLSHVGVVIFPEGQR